MHLQTFLSLQTLAAGLAARGSRWLLLLAVLFLPFSVFQPFCSEQGSLISSEEKLHHFTFRKRSLPAVGVGWGLHGRQPPWGPLGSSQVTFSLVTDPTQTSGQHPPTAGSGSQNSPLGPRTHLESVLVPAQEMCLVLPGRQSGIPRPRTPLPTPLPWRWEEGGEKGGGREGRCV